MMCRGLSRSSTRVMVPSMVSPADWARSGAAVRTAAATANGVKRDLIAFLLFMKPLDRSANAGASPLGLGAPREQDRTSIWHSRRAAIAGHYRRDRPRRYAAPCPI